MNRWTAILVSEVEEWFLNLDEDDQARVYAAIEMLEEHGPALPRPVADRIKGSKHHNLKELRPAASSIRILFIFDPSRQAVLLVAGDKAGNWKGWYETAIPVAEERYASYIAETEQQK